MSRELSRYIDAGEEASPEAAFLRAVIRTERMDSPSGAKMDEIAGRLGPILTNGRTTGIASTVMRYRGASIALMGALMAGIWTVSLQRGQDADRASPRPSVSAVEVAPVDVARSAPMAPERLRAAPEPFGANTPSAPFPTSVAIEALPQASAVVSSRPTSASKKGCTDEVAILEHAEAALRADDGTRALAFAQEHLSRCPTGAFVQERERIAIEALAGLGRFAEMRQRAHAFEDRFRASPHLRRIRKLLADHSE